MTLTNTCTPPAAPSTEALPPEDAFVMGLLSHHIPIALLCDLSSPDGPPSAQILAEEGLPDTAWWEH